jgi:hypothetical protein
MEHQPIEYTERLGAPVPAQECSPQEVAGTTRYSLVCFQCHGQFEIEDDTPLYRGRLWGGKATRPEGDISVVCECGYEHPGRPEGNKTFGCGAVWRLTR